MSKWNVMVKGVHKTHCMGTYRWKWFAWFVAMLYASSPYALDVDVVPA